MRDVSRHVMTQYRGQKVDAPGAVPTKWLDAQIIQTERLLTHVHPGQQG